MSKFSKYRNYRARKRKLVLYVFFLALLSFSFVLMPIGQNMKEQSYIPMLSAGVLFWIGALGLLIVIININHSRRKSEGFKENYPNLRQFGLISFFKNAPAAIADVLMLVSIMGEIVLFFTDLYYLKFIGAAVIVFSFGMHCMLNGINYIYVNYNIRRDRES